MLTHCNSIHFDFRATKMSKWLKKFGMPKSEVEIM